ncbi:hypothetical protein UFOVP810_32 [uncultured Caudovirales phage]|uniref:Uncharacterized protein n=1 Tax=uncultured Caudovirales phage TaxID=2100421 RepID=A0A6J5NVN4_9CAUD|nr:hypothetical protein UFOVP810_32 [uncultured Caudovirales phage]
MARKQATKTVETAMPVNGVPMRPEDMARSVTQALESAGNHDDKKEHALGHAAFVLADFIRKDGMSLDVALTGFTASPDTFFSSEKARQLWQAKETLHRLFGDTSGITAGMWNNTLERAFSLLALHEYLKRNAFISNPNRKEGMEAEYLAVNFERQEVPGMAWLQSKSDWKYLADNGTGKYCMVSFGKKKEFAYGFDAARKGKAKQVTADFYPSLGGFCSQRGAWLTQVEVRQQRATDKGKGANSAAPASMRETLEAANSYMAKADYKVSGDAADAFLALVEAYAAASEANRAMLLQIATSAAQADKEQAQA